MSRPFQAGLALALALFCLSAVAQHGYRIPSDQVALLADADLIEHQRGYGSWLWLSGSIELAGSLRTAGIEFEHFPEAGQIQVHQHRFDPTRLVDVTFGAPRMEDGRTLALVQFHGPVTRADLQGLRSLALEPLQYYPHNAYLIWGQASAIASARSLDNVRFASVFADDWRIHPDLARFEGEIRNINLHFVNSGRVDDFLDRVGALGGRVLDAWRAQPDGRLWDAKITLPAAQLERLKTLPELVSANYMSPEVFLDDESGAQVVAGNLDGNNVPAPGYFDWLGDVGLSGAGVVWAVTDSGVWYGHPDYAGRIVGGANYPGCNVTNPGDELASGGGHGTHVAGIIAGNGSAGFTDSDGFRYGIGVAPEAGIFAQNPICGSQSSWPPSGGWPVLSRDAVRGGAIGQNNSWTTGEGTAHGYQNSERAHDLMVLDGDFDSPELEPFMIVFSAGNSGSGAQTLTAPKEAKNPIVTASTLTYRVNGNVDAISGFSSRGPAVDGRISPTIAAPGQSVSSSRKPNSNNCSTPISGTNDLYAFCSGTSMAAPHASGALVLLAEWWRGFNAGQDFSPAMGKALLVSGARRISASGEPDFNSGFGRVNLGPLVSGELAYEFWDQTELLTESGQQWTRQVGAVDPNLPVKITLAWSDAPGAIGANPALVNDLDLIVSSAGQTWRGNNFSGLYTAPGGTADRRNNLEQVWIEQPGELVTITVDAFQIAGSVLVNDPNAGPAQHFALICENCSETPDFALSVSPEPIEVCLPDQIDASIQVSGIAGFDDPVLLDTSGWPAGVTAELSADEVTPPASVTLTIDAGNGAAPGSHAYSLNGTSSTGPKTLAGNLLLFNQVASAPVLLDPANQASEIPVDAVFSWTATDQAGRYRLEIASDASFEQMVFSGETTATSLQASGLNTSTVYYYRVVVINACGEQDSAVFSFSTQVAPGDCPLASAQNLLMQEDFESDVPAGWSSGGVASTWTRTSTQSTSGDWSMHATNSSSVSDQQLSTSSVSLPSGASGLFLDFQNRQTLESRSGGCWDGAIVEVSNDDGGSWTQVSSSQIVNRPYDGPIGSGYSNPLTGREAWCGDPRAWERYTIDLSDWAGQDVRFRFRLGTDSSVGREGWYIDEVEVRACVLPMMFQDRFESP